ncbi:IS5 family transposase [Deinococcus yavapaiensis]|uniref:Transposase n=1 Tax=Deinococcus yavapaiensis KR-236 TaxID=694435 RepID=A0A318S2F1_9DEIO|nr:IS5 family transposase [Deinococcus yavapaiensis]PYE49471.1 transposase [Deinococcus yavapaiensis KR-236]
MVGPSRRRVVDVLVPDALWAIVQPLLPMPVHPRGGRPFADPRATLAGIIYVLREGIRWAALPCSLGFPSGVTCWRRLRDWQTQGVWPRMWGRVLEGLASRSAIDWSRASVDSASVRALSRGDVTGPNPTDRGRLGTKRHLVVDGQGVPLGVVLSGANRHDSACFEAVLDAIPGIRDGRPGRPRRRPEKVHGDKAYNLGRCRGACRTRGITARLARRGVESSERLGRHRWVVERTLSWLNGFRRLRIRYARYASQFEAFHLLALALICFRRLVRL